MQFLRREQGLLHEGLEVGPMGVRRRRLRGAPLLHLGEAVLRLGALDHLVPVRQDVRRRPGDAHAQGRAPAGERRQPLSRAAEGGAGVQPQGLPLGLQFPGVGALGWLLRDLRRGPAGAFAVHRRRQEWREEVHRRPERGDRLQPRALPRGVQVGPVGGLRRLLGDVRGRPAGAHEARGQGLEAQRQGLRRPQHRQPELQHTALPHRLHVQPLERLGEVHEVLRRRLQGALQDHQPFQVRRQTLQRAQGREAGLQPAALPSGLRHGPLGGLGPLLGLLWRRVPRAHQAHKARAERRQAVPGGAARGADL
mmetsp:Transcript_123776/g.385442  ORF Transcript_123776/g.385442 Transcript_123776/m.385442 type:complete len:309 (+) Transcript_123776:556-1482(+)